MEAAAKDLTPQKERQESTTALSLRSINVADGVVPQNLEDVWTLSRLVHAAHLAPKSLDSIEKVAIGILMNVELGRPVITGLQDLAVINGKCGIYGDAKLAMVNASGEMEPGYPKETQTGTPFEDDWTFTFIVKRKGQDEVEGSFTWKEAKLAGFDNLKMKDGNKDIYSPWTRFPRRMMQWKARAWVLNDVFGDILKGMKSVEELHDVVDLEQDASGAFGPPKDKVTDLSEKLDKMAAEKKEAEAETKTEVEPDPADAPGLKDLPAGQTSTAGGPDQASTDTIVIDQEKERTELSEAAKWYEKYVRSVKRWHVASLEKIVMDNLKFISEDLRANEVDLYVEFRKLWRSKFPPDKPWPPEAPPGTNGGNGGVSEEDKEFAAYRTKWAGTMMYLRGKSVKVYHEALGSLGYSAHGEVPKDKTEMVKVKTEVETKLKEAGINTEE